MNSKQFTSSHALLSVLVANGVDRVFLVPGESYLGILDALIDYPQIDVVTCRHESGAGFMACADGRLTGRPGVAMVSRGPGATNVSIAVHTAQQDAVPLVVFIGQVGVSDLGRGAFQEIDYEKMYGSIAKKVFAPRKPEELAQVTAEAVRIATAETPGPVLIAVPEDIQQQAVPQRQFEGIRHEALPAPAPDVGKVLALLNSAERPLIIAGGAIVRGVNRDQGRAALRAFAEAFQVPVAVSFRRHDVIPNTHELYAGDLGLNVTREQLDLFKESDLVLALGTRLGDVTSQGYSFPQPNAKQKLVHVHPDRDAIGRDFKPDVAVNCDTVALLQALTPSAAAVPDARRQWAKRLRTFGNGLKAWPKPKAGEMPFATVIEKLAEVATPDTIISVDAGTFGVPVYRHFPFVYPQRLMAPLAGAMGYGVPTAIASQLRHPKQRVVCVVGDGGFLMTGNEIIVAVERSLPILFIVYNNNSYGVIRLHQDRHYPGRGHVATSLTNPDFVALGRAFGAQSRRAATPQEVTAALEEAFAAKGPYLLEVPLVPAT